jgi:hypothetical protein
VTWQIAWQPAPPAEPIVQSDPVEVPATEPAEPPPTEAASAP